MDDKIPGWLQAIILAWVICHAAVYTWALTRKPRPDEDWEEEK
jgi:hypothetical protein